MRPDVAEDVFGPHERAAAARLSRITTDLSEAEVILASWGCPVMDARFLESAPRLRLVLYAAGSGRAFVTDEMWERDIRVSGAYALHAISVPEYTLAVILFSLEHGWVLAGDPGSAG